MPCRNDERSVLAPGYFPPKSIIATTVLNFRVRNENGCFHSVKAPERNAHHVCKRQRRTENVRIGFQASSREIGELVRLRSMHHCTYT